MNQSEQTRTSGIRGSYWQSKLEGRNNLLYLVVEGFFYVFIISVVTIAIVAPAVLATLSQIPSNLARNIVVLVVSRIGL